MSVLRDKFIIDAYRLSKASPLIWGEFLASFAAYATDFAESAIMSPTETAAVDQGQARSLLALRRDFQTLENNPVIVKLRSK